MSLIDEFIVRLGYAAAVSVRSCARRDAPALALSPARRSQIITRPRPKRAPVSGRGLDRKRRKSGQLSSWGCRERGDAPGPVWQPGTTLLTATARCRCLLPAGKLQKFGSSNHVWQLSYLRYACAHHRPCRACTRSTQGHSCCELEGITSQRVRRLPDRRGLQPCRQVHARVMPVR